MVISNKASVTIFYLCKFDTLLPVCAAKQIIEWINVNRSQSFQSMMSSVMIMIMNNASMDYFDLLSKFHISTGWRTAERHQKKAGIHQKTSDIKIEPLGSFVLHFDNFGFLGKKGKWLQRTVIQVSIITEKQLCDLGFYN